jgi:type IV secretion system protein VirD4
MDDAAPRRRRWQFGAVLLSMGVLLAGIAVALPLAFLVDRGVSLASLDWVRRYFESLPDHPAYWLESYRRWIGQGFHDGRLPSVLLLPAVLALAVLALAALLNPDRATSRLHGAARWARLGDISRMRLLQGRVIVLGRWGRRRLHLPETLSALCIAPPGTGKTVAVVVPTILDGDDLSMIINDVKPELHQITSGYRQRLGPVYRLEWAARDDPQHGLVHACWNPLSAGCLPAPGAARDLYIDRLAAMLIADPPQGDPHWSRKGRAALAGLTHFIIARCEAGRLDGFPAAIFDAAGTAEPSFPLLLDWLTEATLSAAAAIDELRQSDPNAAFAADPIRDLLMAAVAESRDGDYAYRAILELTQLANTPDRERGSVLSTMDAGLAIFKNEAVRQRTTRSDINFADFRGKLDPNSGQVRPVTLYLCVNQQDSRALGVMTGLFVEALSAYLVAHPPGSCDDSGRIMGPCPALFVLDEFPQMPKLQALIDGPAVGRGQKVSYLLIGQDFGQIEEKYGKPGLETLLSTTAAKIILPLNNEAVAKRFSEMVGNFTHEAATRSRTYGISRQADPFATNISRSLSGVPLIQPADLMSMEQGTQIVIYQSFANCPIRLQSPYFFKDPALRRRAFNPRDGKGPKPAGLGLVEAAEQSHGDAQSIRQSRTGSTVKGQPQAE